MLLSKEFGFEASHILPHHQGKCRNLHGHSWRLVVEVTGPVDAETGFVLDYGQLSRIVNPLVDALDHSHLNFLLLNPTSEAIASLVWRALSPLQEKRFRLSVALSETKKTWCRTRRGIYGTMSNPLPFPGVDELLASTWLKPWPELILEAQMKWAAAEAGAVHIIGDVMEEYALQEAAEEEGWEEPGLSLKEGEGIR